MEHLISLYIDNELNLDEKIDFVEVIHKEKNFKDTAISFLEQEKILYSAIRKESPELPQPAARKFRFFPVPANIIKVAFAVSVLVIFSFFLHHQLQDQKTYVVTPATVAHRFVIYRTDIQQAEIAGSFTNWQRLPLQPAGTSGYWETTLQLPAGEHKFVYILDGSELLADPTVSAWESDDYGTANSILSIGV
jgi:hypothetical protein